MPERVAPEVGMIVLTCGHSCPDKRIHYYDMRSVPVPAVDVDGELKQPAWAALCTECHMDPRATSEKVHMWFQWEEEMIQPKAAVAN